VTILVGLLTFAVVAAIIIVAAFLLWVGPNDVNDSDRDGDHWE
jgi:nitrogen fixation-related uncharacterized protein